MNTVFKEYLDKGYLAPAQFEDEQPMIVEGCQYYQPTESGAKMAVLRFHSALDIIRSNEELQVSTAVLDTAIMTGLDTARAGLKDPSIAADSLIEIYGILERLKARREFGKDVEQVFQLAALWFITEDEDPTSIAAALMQKKITLFKARPDLYGFFLLMPVSRFVQSSTPSDADTLGYLREINLLSYLTYKSHLMNAVKFGFVNDTISNISSAMETLYQSENFAFCLLNNTMKR